MRIIPVFILLLSTVVSFGQTTTYKNVEGTNYINGRTGQFNKSSITWTISQNEDNYNIKANELAQSFNVTYSYFDNANKLYVYIPVGSGKFDNNTVKLVMTNGKMSDYAKGASSDVKILAILFEEDYGLMYKLKE